MEIEMLDKLIFTVMPLAFMCEFIDSSLGMGYGTCLTPVLFLIGFEPLDIVPAVLFSELVTGITATFFHHRLKNANFQLRSKDTKVAIVLSCFAIVGTVVGVFLAVRLPAKILKAWIGTIVVLMGIIILGTINRMPHFRWSKITILGTIASFNKSISGGGYGPLVMGGQLLSGIGVKNAVGITSLTEAVICLVGLILYYFSEKQINWTLAAWLMAGAVLSVPFAACLLKRIPEKQGKVAVSIIVIILGCVTLGRIIVNK
jgi:uncharacterized membrane protein YfcA